MQLTSSGYRSEEEKPRDTLKGSKPVSAVWLIQEIENAIQGRYGKSSIMSRAVILFMVGC